MRVIPSSSSFLLPSFFRWKQSQLLLQPTEVELGLQVGVEFDKILTGPAYNMLILCQASSLPARDQRDQIWIIESKTENV